MRRGKRWPQGLRQLIAAAVALPIPMMIAVTAMAQDAQVSPEKIVLTDGVQPFMFLTSKGTLAAFAQLSFPPGYQQPERNAFPGLPGWVVSRDKGQSWQRWAPGGAPPPSAYKPIDAGPCFEGAATELRDGTLLLLEWVVDGPQADGSWAGNLWESRDDFQTLQGPTAFRLELPQAKTGFDDNGRAYGGVTFHRSLLELPSGDLLAGVYCWFEGDDTPCPYQPTMMKFRSVLLRSSDRGRTWRYASTIAVDPAVGTEGFNEPVIVRLSQGPKEGRLICVMRTGSNDVAMYQAHSDDEGATWSQPRPLDLHGVDPDLIEMSDGTLVCSFGWRIWAGGSANCLAFSTDQGDTWSQVVKLPPVDHDWTKATTCYTAVREIEPGRLLMLYDVGAWGLAVRYIGSREVRVSGR